MTNKSIKKFCFFCLGFASLVLTGCFHVPDEDWLLSNGETKYNTSKNNDLNQTFDSFIDDFNSIADQRAEMKSENSDKKESFEKYWDGLSESGIDEDIFFQSVNQEMLEKIANSFYALINEETKEEQENPSILFNEGWTRVFNKESYKEVVQLGKEAEKPLYWILYKSENNGLYEYLCASALQDISGITFSKDNGNQGWSNAKEYLKLFTDYIRENIREKK